MDTCKSLLKHVEHDYLQWWLQQELFSMHSAIPTCVRRYLAYRPLRALHSSKPITSWKAHRRWNSLLQINSTVKVLQYSRKKVPKQHTKYNNSDDTKDVQRTYNTRSSTHHRSCCEQRRASMKTTPSSASPLTDHGDSFLKKYLSHIRISVCRTCTELTPWTVLTRDVEMPIWRSRRRYSTVRYASLVGHSRYTAGHYFALSCPCRSPV